MELKQLEKNIIVEMIVGSNAYGTSTPESDTDYRGIVFAPKEYVYGMEKFEQFQGFKDEDKVLYELKFALGLMTDNNPNMIDLLFVDSSFWTKSTKYWEKIQENRDLFLSKKLRYTFAGYAFQQLRRIESHRKWLFNPITEKPNREDFGLSENEKDIPGEQLRAILTIEPKFLSDSIRETAINEKRYDTALREYNSYINWKKNRNSKRAVLEEKVGYDCKHASHLIRLIRMAKEILSTGKVNVCRKNIDADYLMKIRNCEVSYDEILNEAKTMDEDMNKLYETSALPHSPNRKKINELLIELYEMFMKECI